MANGESSKKGQGGNGATQDRGGSKPGLSPNDDRGIVKNDNNPAFDADAANQKKQKSGGG